jgi:riboflavin biosynthesis pyrimidine reductase
MTKFERLVERKTREAMAAEIPPLRTVGVAATTGLARIGNAWSRRLFDGDFYLSPEEGTTPAGSLVFVQSREGNTGGPNPSALGGGVADLHLIYEGLSRVAAHAVLAGAGTAGGSGVILSVWRPELVALRAALGLPRHPIQIVVTTGRPGLEDTFMLNVPELQAILIASAEYVDARRDALARRPWITAIPLNASGLRGAFETLRTMGIGRVSVIGGRTMARSLISAGLVRDLYLTTSPRAGGEPDTPLFPTPFAGTLVVRKCGTGADEGVVFEHLLVRRPQSGNTEDTGENGGHG